ncbi:hypothetical protein [Paenibacillus sp.]|jgi:hypothetical protein|uniref:hypothetical protein n=1 Tax=Paenibacillus sp. TaxID=58172 RepID=UPI0028227B7F|nr:hypothetical protein [Paenibacillus sp.]MDR0271004.1 hypothetical protein [Paenibacillus sp.]
MDYQINKRLRNYLNYESLKVFLKRVGVSSTGVKNELIARIEECLNNGGISHSVWEEFLVDELKHGHNRSVYRSKLNSASLTKIKTVGRLNDSFQTAGYPVDEFSMLKDTYPDSDDPELVHYSVILDKDNVQKIEMCFAYRILTNRVVLEGIVIQDDETDYVWIEINIIAGLLTISLRPRGNMTESSGHTYQLFEKYSSLLTDLFSIRYLDNEDFKVVLFNVFKELTSRAETPYVQQVKPLEEEINEICDRFSETLGLPNKLEPINLPLRIRRLFERALIQNDFFNFKSYSEGKLGTIEKFHYADDTGARINASANDGDGIELSDIYFDTRDTIEDQRSFNKLWVKWFLPDSPTKYVDVRLEGHPKYYLIHFFKYLSGGDKEYVLSTVEAFR